MSTVAIQATDLVLCLSGGAANTNPNLALGGARSTHVDGVVTDDVTNAVWDNVARAEATPGDIEYRCLFVLNKHASVDAVGLRVWISLATLHPLDHIDIGLDPADFVSAAQGPLADESTAPTGVTFAHPSTFGGALLIGDLPFGKHKAIWLKRTVGAGAPARPGNQYILSFQCET